MVYDTAPPRNVEGALHLQVGAEELYATIVHLDRIVPEAQSSVLGQEAIFIVFSTQEETPQLRLSSQPVDIVWLDTVFRVVEGERGALPGSSPALQPPEGAVYGLVTRVGTLTDSAFVEGSEVAVLNAAVLE